MQWGNMSQLFQVDLGYNNLSGSVPESWSHLRYVALVNDTLVSSTPATWSSLMPLSILACCPLQEHIMVQVPCCYHQFVDTSCLPLYEGLHVHVHIPRSVQYLKMCRIACHVFCRHLNLTNDKCPEALINTGVAKCTQLSLFLSSTTWARCKTATLLPVCVAEPTCFTGWSDIGGEYLFSDALLCNINYAAQILIVLWFLLASLLAVLWGTLAALRYWQAKQVKGLVVDSNKGWQTIIGSMQHGWSQALKWKPWGLRMSALLGLGMFYFDKASDITLLKQVFGHTWTGYALLVLLLNQYVLQGYILMYQLTTKFIGWTVWTKLFLLSFVLAIPLGVPLTIVLDVLLLFADLGIPLKYIDQQVNLEHYQLFRDAGRTLYGTVPTVILQSVTFTRPANPQNGLVLPVKVFMISFVAAGLQLLKVNGEVIYFAFTQKEHAAQVFWQLLSAQRFVKESPTVLLTAHSGVELLARQHATSSDPNIA